MKALLKSLLLILVGAGLTLLLLGRPFSGEGPRVPEREAATGGAASTEATMWTCGMHPQVIQDRPGTCPICRMDLVPMASLEPAGDPAPAGWVCPEHPELIREDSPGTCPIDGLPLVPAGRAEHGHEAKQGRGPVVEMDAGVIQRMNVRTELAERGRIVRRLRTVGSFAYDQEKMVTVTTKFEGYIEKAHVSYVGQQVRRGQPLFEIFSRELVQTQQELLSALEYSKRLGAADADTRKRAENLVQAAHRRLSYWDIGADQVRRIEATGEIRRSLTIDAPISGIVMRRPPGLEGMAVRPGTEILHLVDAGTLWLETEMYEDQLAWIAVGTEAEVTLEAYPDLHLTSTVRFIDPEVTETTRTVAVTFSIPNPDGRLKVGMWASVEFATALASDVVVVPSQAVLRTGERDVVVLALGEGRFAPQDVRLGPEGEGRVAILSGLEAGSRIVSSAQFLIDSESNLREAIQKMIADRRKKG